MSILYEVTTNTLLRGRELSVSNLPDPIPCNPGTTGLNCICPGNCLTYYNITGGCHPNDCWKWDAMKNQCQEDGKPYMPAIILQGIPFTGIFGSGFGNMGRWDIFLNYMLYIFGGCLVICCFNMCCSMAHITNDDQEEDDKSPYVILASKCGTCLWTIGILVLYIWGIVVIANKEVDAPWTDWQGKSILCPLVG